MNPDSGLKLIGIGIVALFLLVILPYTMYTECRIEVPVKHMAILMKKTGLDLENNQVIALTPEYKGVQLQPLTEGRYYYNPYVWDWEVVPQIEIPEGKLGVRIRLYGEDLPPGDLIAWKDEQKGIVPDVLRPGRYAVNAIIAGQDNEKVKQRYEDNYAEIIELHDPVSISAGFRGVVTELSSPLGKANELLAEKGKRGVQAETLEPGTYYINPYQTRIHAVDCRSQRYSMGEKGELGFPTKDGFWVSVEGAIEFRVSPKEVARVFVIYNEGMNHQDTKIDEEIIKKVILPNARSYTRLRGSNYLGKEFIAGDTRVAFQKDFQTELRTACATEGIEIVQALITRINPPQKIADPVRKRQIALQQEKQYLKEIDQQKSEQDLAKQKAMVEQSQALVQADNDIIKLTTEAKQKQEVAKIEAGKRKVVAEQKLLAAKDKAAAALSKGTAEADVIRFTNEAKAAGWKRSVEAFGGDGNEFAKMTLMKKLAPAFQSIMVNTNNSPLMEIFREFSAKHPVSKPDSKPFVPAPRPVVTPIAPPVVAPPPVVTPAPVKK